MACKRYRIDIPLIVEIDCDSTCYNCKYGLKPSECEPWNLGAFELKKVIYTQVLNQIDKMLIK